MSNEMDDRIREALASAMTDLLEGNLPGPLTQTRLVELAQERVGADYQILRHRLTHDNPDINAEFQERKRNLNRTKPEVDRLRQLLADEKTRNARVVAENCELKGRLQAYASTLSVLVDERDNLRAALNGQHHLPRIGKFE